MEQFLSLAIIVILSYLLGSIPTAVLISKRFFGFDIRTKGSGNMGSTNAFRVLGWKWGLLVQILDVLKGLLAVTIVARYFGDDLAIGSGEILSHKTVVMLIAGVSAVIGHIWSVFVNFKGGKGINTAAGMLIGIAPVDMGVSMAIFALAVAFSGYISLGSIMGSLAFPSSIFVRYNLFNVNMPEYQTVFFFALGISILLVFSHRSNIGRLIKGQENRFSKLHILRCKSADKSLSGS